MSLLNVKNLLAKILTKIDEPVVIKKISLGSATVSANASFSLNLWTPCQNACPSGYSFVGLAGFSTNNGNVPVVSIRPTDSQWSFEVRNVYSGTSTITPEVWAMYVRN